MSDGSYSSALSNTYFLISVSSSFLDACNQSFFDFGIKLTAFESNALVLSGGLNLAASSQMSSFSRKFEQAYAIMFLACYIFPSSSSTLAAAIHPEALFGLLVITDFKRERAFLMSLISWAELNVRLSKSVM
jgi:hypothetical protein